MLKIVYVIGVLICSIIIVKADEKSLQLDSKELIECNQFVDSIIKNPSKYIELVNHFKNKLIDSSEINEIPFISYEIQVEPYLNKLKFDFIIQESKETKFLCKNFKKSKYGLQDIYYIKYYSLLSKKGGYDYIYLEFQFVLINNDWYFNGIKSTKNWHCME